MAVDPTSELASVVIPTFNRRQSLAKVVTPLLADPGTGEIVLVVDGSLDGSFEFLSEWAEREPRIRAVFQKNAGADVARQRGIEVASYDIVVLLDDDVLASEGLIEAHARWHSENVNRLVVGYMPTEVPAQRRAGQVATILYAQDYEEVCASYESDPQTILTRLWSGNVSLRRNVALSVSIASAGPLIYHEDVRFGLRCQEAGVEAVFDRSLLAWHSHDRDLRRFAVEARRSGEGKAQLIDEYPALANEMDPLATLSTRERYVLRILAWAPVRPLSAALLMAVSFVSGRLKAWKLEMFSARVLRQIELLHGFNRAGKETGANK